MNPAQLLQYIETIEEFGGEGSGNFDHSGRPGEVGGSGEGGIVEQTHSKEDWGKEEKQYIGYRASKEINKNDTRGIFLSWDKASAEEYGKGNADEKVRAFNIKVEKPVYAKKQNDLTKEWFGKSANDMIANLDSKTHNSRTSMAMLDEKIGKEARKRGYRTIVYTEPLAPAEKEMVALYPEQLEEVKEKSFSQSLSSYIDVVDAFGGEGSGNFGHAGREGEVGGSSSDGGTGGGIKGSGNTRGHIEPSGIVAEYQIMKDTKVDKSTAIKYKDAIQSFTGSKASEIKKMETLEDKEKIANIESYIEKSPKYKGSLFRGVNGNEELTKVFTGTQKGDVVDMKGISSWTSNKQVATKFAKYYEGSGILFSVNDSVKGTSIKHISIHPAEDEVLHSSKTQFKITSKRYDPQNKRWLIDLEEL